MAMAANGSGGKWQWWQMQQQQMAAAAAVINPVAIPLWWKLMATSSPAVESHRVELVAMVAAAAATSPVTLPNMVAAVANTTMLFSMAPSSMDDGSLMKLSEQLSEAGEHFFTGHASGIYWHLIVE